MLENEQTERFIRGEIMFTIYENSAEQFSIAKIKIHETNEAFEEKEIVGKGNFIQLQKGVVYQFYGQLSQHPKFGLQYDIHAYQTFIPETKDAVIAYLSSDLFPGVGKQSARKIVQALGEDAIHQILEDPEVLSSIKGISEKVKRSLYENLEENQGFEKLAVQMTKYGIGLKMAQTLYRRYRGETLDRLQENPYQFVFELEQFGFATADKIAQINGMQRDDPKRIQASAYYALQLAARDGHVYLPIQDCLDKMKEILQVASLRDEQLLEEVQDLMKKEILMGTEEKLYLPSLFVAERRFSERVLEMVEQTIDLTFTDAQIMETVGEIEEEESISYGQEQFSAIQKAIASPIMILTGGPGTGKTTVVKGIIKTFAKLYETEDDTAFILTAPTGRAAKRLEESTGMKAMTIHRLLGWDGHLYFEKNEHEPLEGKLLIIDEFSMVDTWLAHHLFKAIPSDMQVIIVGDEDQLPSVGPGQVLADLLESKCIPTVQLEEVYRQQEGSKIIDLAHDIKHDRLRMEEIHKEKDFSFIECAPHQVVDLIVTIIKKATDKGLALDDFQVLAPMYRTLAGIDEINRQLQAVMNPKKHGRRERIIGETSFRVGDRVLQLVNQPEDGVYNGDIGKIVQIQTAKDNEEKEERIIIRFDQKEVTYTRSDYLNFTLAYCISIHKAQGSEFPNVILPVVSSFRRMLRKNLLYTAITRSKDSLIICGEKEAFMKGIETIDSNTRYTSLPTYLERRAPSEQGEIKQGEAAEIEGAIDEKQASDLVEEDEASLSPYDFL